MREFVREVTRRWPARETATRIFSCPDNRYDKRRALARNQRSVKTAQTEDMGRASCWIELDVIAPPVPGITRIIEQIVHLIWLAFTVTEQFDWHVDHRVLPAIRIEIYHDENDVLSSRCCFAIKQDRPVVCVVETQIIVELQRPILTPDRVQARDKLFDITRRVPVALLKLILLRIEVFFAPRQSGVFAELESAVNAVDTRQRGSQHRTNHKRRTTATLQNRRQNVGRV